LKKSSGGLEKICDELSEGLFIKNVSIVIDKSNSVFDCNDLAKLKLREISDLWSMWKSYDTNDKFGDFRRLITLLDILRNQLIHLRAGVQDPALREVISRCEALLMKLTTSRVFLASQQSVAEFESTGDGLVAIVDAL
jgi:hypothetical protein